MILLHHGWILAALISLAMAELGVLVLSIQFNHRTGGIASGALLFVTGCLLGLQWKVYRRQPDTDDLDDS